MTERGSFLVAAVWGVSIFSIMAASLVTLATQEICLMNRETRAFSQRLDLESGLAEAVAIIREDPKPYEDSTESIWYGDAKLRCPLEAKLSIRLEDEEAKININFANASLLASFFNKIEDVGRIHGSAKEYTKTILKMRSKARIESMEELLLMEGFDKSDFKVLSDYLTVYSECPAINLNTASSLILNALIDSLSADHASKLTLASVLAQSRENGFIFRSDDLNPEIFMNKMKLSASPLMAQAVQSFLSAVTTDSRTYHLSMESKRGSQAIVIFRLNNPVERPVVLYWHEEI